MLHREFVVHARYILPIVPHRQILENCSLHLRDGRILAILPSHSARRMKDLPSVDLKEHLLMPGLVNAHGHLAMSLLRGYADDYPLSTWLNEHIWPTEQRWVDADFIAAGNRLAMAEMIRSGTTCFSDMYFFPEVCAEQVDAIGMRCQLACPIIDFSNAWARNAEEGLAKTLELMDRYRLHSRIKLAFGPHAPYTVNDAMLSKIASLSEQNQHGIQIHLHETATEVTDSLRQYGHRPIERLDNLGLLSPLTQCVHVTQCDKSDIKRLSNSGSHVIHCPASNLKLASGFCPVQLLLEADINVALGSDGAASNNGLDLFAEMRLAGLLAKAVANKAEALNAHDCLRMATLNGARALGIDDEIGSLEPGKQADFIALRIDQIEQQPLHKPASQLVYSASGHLVTHVWVQGRPLMIDRHLTVVDTEQVLEDCRIWQQRLKTSH